MSEPYISIILPVNKQMAEFEKAKENILAFFKILSGTVEVISLGQEPIGEFVFYLDSNLSIPLVDVLAFLAEFKNSNSDIIIGDRHAPQSKVFHTRTPREAFEDTILSGLVKKKFKLEIPDPLCPIIGVRRSKLQKLFFER